MVAAGPLERREGNGKEEDVIYGFKRRRFWGLAFVIWG
jgi:hypothetical protein